MFAAASLAESFEEIGRQFEEEYGAGGATREEAGPVEVSFNFAGSSALAEQLRSGAPADVLATADERTMEQVAAAGLVAESVPFATNTLTIVSAPGNPLGIAGPEDLTREETQVVVCAPQVPCGAATTTVMEPYEDAFSPVSEENNVTDVLGKVTSGQADAGLVYVTDALSAGDTVETVEFPSAAEAVNTYPIATLLPYVAGAGPAGADGSEDDDAQEVDPLAQAFVDFVRGPAGQTVLEDAGFQEP